MNQDLEVRVATDAKYKELYNNLKECGAISDFHVFFFCCASIGYKRGMRIPLKKRDDRFFGKTFTSSEWACLYTMILKENFDYSLIKNVKDIIRIVEEYANAGVEYIIDNLLNPYLLPKSKSIDPKIDSINHKDLPLRLLQFLYALSASDYDWHE